MFYPIKWVCFRQAGATARNTADEREYPVKTMFCRAARHVRSNSPGNEWFRNEFIYPIAGGARSCEPDIATIAGS